MLLARMRIMMHDSLALDALMKASFHFGFDHAPLMWLEVSSKFVV